MHDPNYDHVTRVLPDGRSSDLLESLPHGGLGTSSFQQNIVSGESPGRDPVASVKVYVQQNPSWIFGMTTSEHTILSNT